MQLNQAGIDIQQKAYCSNCGETAMIPNSNVTRLEDHFIVTTKFYCNTCNNRITVTSKLINLRFEGRL